MSFWQGNIISGANENPLITAAKGELFVPIGDEEHPPLARWLIIIFFALAVVISIALFINRQYTKSITLPERNSSMIGYRVDEIDGIPKTVTYAGVEFAYEVIDFEGIISGCAYTAHTSVEVLDKVIDSLLKRYGNPDEFDEILLTELTKEELAALDSATWTWNYGKRTVQSLEELDNWGSNVAGYYINPTYLYMDLSVMDAENGEVNIEIRYEVRPRY